MISSSGSLLKSGSTFLRGGPTNLGKSKMGGGPTRLGGDGQSKRFGGGYGNRTIKGPTTSNTEQFKDERVTTPGGTDRTPKPLITPEFLQETQVLAAAMQEAKADKSNTKGGYVIKQSSVFDSSMKGQNSSSQEKSSDSIKMSSSNLGQNQSSFQDSKRSDQTDPSEDDLVQKEKRKAKRKEKNDVIDLEENIIVNICETDTQTLLFIPSTIVSQDNPQYVQQQEINKKYDELISKKAGNDNFGERYAQTFNYAQKQKEQMTLRVDKNDVSCDATLWNIIDTQNQEQYSFYELLQQEMKKTVEKELEEALKNPQSLLPTNLKSIYKHADIPQKGQTSKNNKSDNTSKGDKTSKITEKLDGDSFRDSSSNFTGSKIAQSKNQTKVDASGGLTSEKTSLLNKSKGRTVVERVDQDEINQNNAKLVPPNKPAPPPLSDEELKLVSNDNFHTQLKFVERILNQNTYQKQYIQYRNYPEAVIQTEKLFNLGTDLRRRVNRLPRATVVSATGEDSEEETQDQKNDNQPKIQHLFNFSCDLTQDRNISSADWNKINEDLLAVSYGEYDLISDHEGLLMFWTLKNPHYPERIIKTQSRITSCKFSARNPNLISIGCYNGVIAIYDIRQSNNNPIADSTELERKHLDTVWEVQWIGSGGNGGKGENIVSISGDGRIVEWSMKKGLESQDLMTLKRQANPNQKEDGLEAVNFRYTAGFSFDFLKNETSMYLTCTEDGTIHRCSRSYTEQYLDTYYGHTGPVYKVRCNPFWQDIFLSCSADWTSKIWNWKEEKPLTTLKSLDLNDEIMDVEWSPMNSSVFASVAKDGRLELWDLSRNILDPILSEKSEGLAPKSMVRFCQNYPVVITGDTNGVVQLYRTQGFTDTNLDEREQITKLQRALYPSGYTQLDKLNEENDRDI